MVSDDRLTGVKRSEDGSRTVNFSFFGEARGFTHFDELECQQPE
jgi:hypothetical protein